MPSIERRPLVWLAGVLLVALTARLAVAVWWQARLDGGLFFGDSESYWALARALARGEEYQFGSADARIFRTPGYPLALAPLFLLFGDHPPIMAARGLGVALGTATVAGVYWLGHLLWDARVGLVGALAAAVYPGAVAISVFVLSEALFAPLVLLELALWIIAVRAPSSIRSAGWGLAAGVVGGAAALTRPSWLLFAPFAALALLVFTAQRSRHALVAAALLLGIALTMSPWWVRNARLTGHFVPTTLQVGASLYDGLNPRATAASDMSFVPAFEADERARPAAADAPPFEYRLDARLRDEAVDWAVAHPNESLRLAGLKVLRLWNIWPNEVAFRTPTLRLVVLATFVPAILLALAGAWRFRGLGGPVALLWLPAVYTTLLHVVFVSSLRYREPVMLLLLALAAAQLVGRRASIHSLNAPPSKDGART